MEVTPGGGSVPPSSMLAGVYAQTFGTDATLGDVGAAPTASLYGSSERAGPTGSSAASSAASVDTMKAVQRLIEREREWLEKERRVRKRRARKPSVRASLSSNTVRGPSARAAAGKRSGSAVSSSLSQPNLAVEEVHRKILFEQERIRQRDMIRNIYRKKKKKKSGQDEEDDAPRFPLGNLSGDLVYHVFSYLNINELAACSCTCKAFGAPAEDAIVMSFNGIFGERPQDDMSRRMLFKILGKAHFVSNRSTTELFLWSCARGYIDYVQRLLDTGMISRVRHGVNACKSDGTSALHLATEKGYQMLVALLLEARADPYKRNKAGRNIAHVAAENGQVELLRSTLQTCDLFIDTADEQNNTCLMLAAARGHVRVLRELLRNEPPPDVNLQNADGKTALFFASDAGKTGAVRCLLEAEADVFISAETGKTPLYVAAENGYHRVVGLLLDHGADARQETARHKTPLYPAAEKGHVAVVKLLLQHASVPDLFRLSQYGTTPMYIAAKQPSKEIKKMFLEFCLTQSAESQNIPRPSSRELARIKTPRYIEDLEQFGQQVRMRSKATRPAAFERRRSRKRTTSASASNTGTSDRDSSGRTARSSSARPGSHSAAPRSVRSRSADRQGRGGASSRRGKGPSSADEKTRGPVDQGRRRKGRSRLAEHEQKKQNMPVVPRPAVHVRELVGRQGSRPDNLNRTGRGAVPARLYTGRQHSEDTEQEENKGKSTFSAPNKPKPESTREVSAPKTKAREPVPTAEKEPRVSGKSKQRSRAQSAAAAAQSHTKPTKPTIDKPSPRPVTAAVSQAEAARVAREKGAAAAARRLQQLVHESDVTHTQAPGPAPSSAPGMKLDLSTALQEMNQNDSPKDPDPGLPAGIKVYKPTQRKGSDKSRRRQQQAEDSKQREPVASAPAGTRTYPAVLTDAELEQQRQAQKQLEEQRQAEAAERAARKAEAERLRAEQQARHDARMAEYLAELQAKNKQAKAAEREAQERAARAKRKARRAALRAAQVAKQAEEEQRKEEADAIAAQNARIRQVLGNDAVVDEPVFDTKPSPALSENALEDSLSSRQPTKYKPSPYLIPPNKKSKKKKKSKKSRRTGGSNAPDYDSTRYTEPQADALQEDDAPSPGSGQKLKVLDEFVARYSPQAKGRKSRGRSRSSARSRPASAVGPPLKATVFSFEDALAAGGGGSDDRDADGRRSRLSIRPSSSVGQHAPPSSRRTRPHSGHPTSRGHSHRLALASANAQWGSKPADSSSSELPGSARLRSNTREQPVPALARASSDPAASTNAPLDDDLHIADMADVDRYFDLNEDADDANATASAMDTPDLDDDLYERGAARKAQRVHIVGSRERKSALLKRLMSLYSGPSGSTGQIRRRRSRSRRKQSGRGVSADPLHRELGIAAGRQRMRTGLVHSQSMDVNRLQFE